MIGKLVGHTRVQTIALSVKSAANRIARRMLKSRSDSTLEEEAEAGR